MSRQILIVEDNEGVGSLLDEVVRGSGATSRRLGSGSAAIASLSQGLPDAVIVDVVLADLDGLQVADAARQAAGGAHLPIIVISGVFKKLPDDFVQRVRPHFLPKPFEPAALQALLNSVLRGPQGSPARPSSTAPGESAGENDALLSGSPHAVLLRLCEQRATGVLDAVQGQVRRRLVLQLGQIRYAQSNVLSENVGGSQVATGELSREAFDRAVAHARTARVALPEALAVTGALSPDTITAALRQQTTDVTVGFLATPGARFSFTESDVSPHPEARRHPVELVIEHIRRTVSTSDAKALLERHPDGRVSRSALLERESFIVRSTVPGEGVTALLSSGPTLRDLVKRVRSEELAFLWALVASTLATVKPTAQAAASPSAEQARDPDAGRTFSAEEIKAREFIFAEARRLEPLDHYATLGVNFNAPAADCRRAYLSLARRYHSDSYAGLDLGHAATVLSSLFQRLNEAMETLTDEERRTEYAIYLDRKAKGLPTDVGAILEAEALFQKGELLAKQSKWQDASDLFEQALKLNHAEPEFHVYAAVAAWRLNTLSLEEARRNITRALEDSPNMVSGHVYLGALAREEGDARGAKAHLSRALELDPRQEQALAEMRALNEKSTPKSAGARLRSFFGK